MAEEEIVLSDKTKESFRIPKGVRLNEQLLSFYCNLIIEQSQENVRVIDIEESDIEVLQKYIDSRQADLRIDGKRVVFDNDYEDYVQFARQRDPRIPILVRDFKQFERMVKKFNLKDCNVSLEIQENDLNKISKEELQEFTKKYKIKKCELRMNNILKTDLDKASLIPKIELYFKDCFYKEKDINTTIQIKEKIKELTKDINGSDTDLKKFSTIYKKIGENITYDRTVCEVINLKKERIKNNEKISQDQEEQIAGSQNLTGLITGASVCAGFSRILQCSLNSVGIECEYIYGQTNSKGDESHAWNQVKIDGKWYNTDITWDQNSIEYYKLAEDGVISHYPKNLKYLEYCLKSDEEFENHFPKSKNNVKCQNSIDERELKDAFGFKGNEEIERKDIVPYNAGIWTNLRMKFDEYYNKIANFINKKDMQNVTIEATNKIQAEEKEELKPWDLKNWSQEEIDQAKKQDTLGIKENKKVKDEEER